MAVGVELARTAVELAPGVELAGGIVALAVAVASLVAVAADVAAGVAPGVTAGLHAASSTELSEITPR